MRHTGGFNFQVRGLTYSRVRQANNNGLSDRLMGVLVLVVIAALACASPAAENSPGDTPPAVPKSPTTQPEAVVAAGEIGAFDLEATWDMAKSDVEIDPHVEDLQRIAAAAVQLDVDAFAEIKPGGPRDVDPRRFRQLIGRDRIVPIYEPLPCGDGNHPGRTGNGSRSKWRSAGLPGEPDALPGDRQRRARRHPGYWSPGDHFTLPVSCMTGGWAGRP